MPEPSFAELMVRVREGDQQAAAELVRSYEPAIRRAVHFRLTNAHARNILDSMDIFQSVMASFFLRAASGEYQLDQPEDLQKFLAAMARNKLKHQLRKQYAQRRDGRRIDAAADPQAVAGAEPSPSRHFAARELLNAVHERLTPEERQLVEWRQQGLEWDAIALQAGGKPEALRKKLSRALDRVAVELGVDEDNDA